MSDSSHSSSYEFDLPADLIAQDPPVRRGDSRLLLVEPDHGVVGERPFVDLSEILRAGDLLVLNESRVLPARLLTLREDTGGQVEILLVRPVAEPRTWLALARPGRRLRAGTRLVIRGVENGPALEITERRDQGEVLVTAEVDPGKLAEDHGVMPLPPYIRRGADDFAGARGVRDRERYQTVFAEADGTGAGSVAAPTAGLHFSNEHLARLEGMGVGIARVSLHVGPGTFRTPTEEQIAARRLHREFFRLSPEVSALLATTKASGGRIIAVGTTSLRVLETVARLGLTENGTDRLEFGTGDEAAPPEFCGEAVRRGRYHEVCGETRLFLRPPDRVGAVDGLLTNFHLPGSSLLMLVATLAGEQTWPTVYDHAVRERFRFYSYGDCMLILPGLSGWAGAKGI